MKIHVANYEPGRVGGGWTFARNLHKAIPDLIGTYEESDIYFVTSASMVAKEDVYKAKEDGKVIVLRIDNAVRNSRNRNTGMSRMKSFSDLASAVVFQSDWSKRLLGDQFLKTDGRVIMNGCDQDVFNMRGRTEAINARFLYSRFNRDETKNWEMARYIFQQEAYDRKGEAELNIVGQFSPELIQYNFDFYQDEKFKYWGVIPDENTLASIYRNNDYIIFTYFNDACSNTLIEAVSCGLEICDPYDMIRTGGSMEIFTNYKAYGDEYLGLDRMGAEYRELFNSL